MTKVFIDGSEGTTGLQIRDRLSLRDDIDLVILPDEKRKISAERKKALNSCDIAILCLPDAAAEEAVHFIDNPDVKVIDASTAHRTDDNWVYGFPELKGQREKIHSSKRISNPGCYATGFISLIKPLVDYGILDSDISISCYALSGYTGGGKKTIAQYESEDRDIELDGPRLYSLGLNHKHIPEIMKICALKTKPLFMPIICNFPRGMAVSILLNTDQFHGIAGISDLRSVYSDYYESSRVISMLPEGEPNNGFLGSNNLAGKDRLEIFVGGNDKQIILVSRLDNLGKGASGAAVQNLNILIGAEETKGLQL